MNSSPPGGGVPALRGRGGRPMWTEGILNRKKKSDQIYHRGQPQKDGGCRPSYQEGSHARAPIRHIPRFPVNLTKQMSKAGRIVNVSPRYALPGGEILVECEGFTVDPDGNHGCIIGGEPAR